MQHVIENALHITVKIHRLQPRDATNTPELGGDLIGKLVLDDADRREIRLYLCPEYFEFERILVPNHYFAST